MGLLSVLWYMSDQSKSAKGRVKPVHLKPLPVVTEPLSKLGVDVGPLSLSFAKGHRYILILIDFATKFPEALPLKDVASISWTD